MNRISTSTYISSPDKKGRIESETIDLICAASTGTKPWQEGDG